MSHHISSSINNNNINPSFDFEGTGITEIEIKTHGNELLNLAKTVADQKANKFPVEIFPSLFQELIVECNRALNFPIDYTGVAILSACSAIIGKSSKLIVKKGWSEFASLFIALIGNPGASKSHPIQLAFNPLEEADRVSIQNYTKELSGFEAFQALSKKEKENLPIPERPTLVKTVLHNFTPEVLAQRLADNPRGCIIVSEELATFLEGMNNYSKGDQTSTYLSFWSNKPTTIDRISKPIPLWIPQPFLNIIGSLQPRVLPQLFPAKKINNGFIQRFLFAFPDIAEKQPINDEEIEESLFRDYSDWFEDYRKTNPVQIDRITQKHTPKSYHWSNEAKVFFYSWQKENTEKINENPDCLLAEMLCKFDIHFIRISLVLQIMSDYNTNEISLKAAQGASKLCEYFKRNAMKVLKILESVNPLEVLPQKKVAFYNSLSQDFTTAQANSIGREFDFNIKTVQRFLLDQNLFDKTSHGHYSKKTGSQMS
ncbi:hypothetical protein BH10BAC3_BH10BAC3_16170 [soil metagenome]